MQRLQPINIFCIKTSIILFYIRIFDTPRFKLVAFIVWIYTLLLAISIWFATLFECRPISFFWDKDQDGGVCVNNPLITIGLTSGVLSCVGDIVIFLMPIPALSKLRLEPKKKGGLIAIFLLGLSVVCTSFIRWVALLGIDANITGEQPRNAKLPMASSDEHTQQPKSRLGSGHFWKPQSESLALTYL